MRLALVLLLVFHALVAVADEARPLVPIVAAGDDGTCYAKSVPDDVVGPSGTTTVYNVRAGNDEPRETYDWYALQMHVLCNVWTNAGTRTTVARMGPWASGQEANDTDLAVAFYANGHLLHSYSTLDVAGVPEKVGRSVSHYVVFNAVDGFHWWDNRKLEFRATRVDGTTFRVDPGTGAVLSDD